MVDYRKYVFPFLLLIVVIGSLFSFGSPAVAQTPPASTDTVLQPIANYRNKNLSAAEKDLGSCFATFAFAGVSTGPICANVVTKEDLEDNSSFNSLAIKEGDVLRCSVPTRVGGIVTKCTTTHADGSAMTTQKGADGVASIETSYTSVDGTTTKGSESENSDGILDAAGDAVTQGAASVARDAGTALIEVVGGIILTFSTLMLGMAGVLLNVVIAKAVFGFSTVIGNSPGLLIAWGVLRDLGNMLLLFGFIFMGIATILDLNTYNAKKALPNLIIFAILMNFSLFVSEAVIDVSNGLASTIYSQSSTACDEKPLGGEVSSTISGDGVNAQKYKSDCTLNYGIGGDIMKVSGLSTLFSAFNLADGSDLTKSIVVYLGLSLFAIIGAVVLFAAAIMLVVRTVILTFLIIISPVGFAGMAIPPLSGYAKQWRDALINQSLFAPVLLLLILISLKVASTFAGEGENKSLAAALISPSSDVMGVIFVFMLVIGLLIGALIMAKKFGAMGGDAATALGTRLAFGGVARGGNAIFNGTGRALNNGTTRGVARLQNSQFAQRNRFTRGVTAGVTGAANALSSGVFKPLETSNSDLRRVPGVSKALSQAGAGESAKPATNATLADMQKQYKDSKKKLGSSAFNNQVDRLRIEQAFTAAGGGANGALAAIALFNGKGLSQISPADVAKLPSALLTRPEIVPQLTQKMLEEMQNAGKLKPGEMATIGTNIRGVNNNNPNGATQRLFNYVSRGPGSTIW